MLKKKIFGRTNNLHSRIKFTVKCHSADQKDHSEDVLYEYAVGALARRMRSVTN